MSILRNRFFIISIIVLVVISVVASVLLNTHGYSREVYFKSLKAFNTIESAYKEGRELSDYEKMQIKEFKQFADDQKEQLHALDSANITKRDQKDFELISRVNFVAELYAYVGDEEYEQDDTTLELFHQNYKKAKSLLK